MPWENKTVEDLRKEFTEAAKDCDNFSQLCREFKITRKTGYKWLEREESGESLSDKSRAPITVANKTSERVEQKILEVRSLHEWGAKKIKRTLEDEGYVMPCVKTINNILKRNGCISPEESKAHIAYTSFEKSKCNEMWQTDFKGEFRMGDGNLCYPLDIFDDHSRYVIAIKPSLTTAGVVIPTFEAAFYEFGMPYSVLSDNGGQFAGFRHGYTQFEKWLMNHDVLPIHGRIKHPQTQGKIERFHRTMKYEVLRRRTLADIHDAELTLSAWRDTYNNVRPHEALGMKRPGDVYVPSDREYCDKVQKYEYSGLYHVIKVNNWGYVRFDQWQVYLSETMRGEYIEFRPNPLAETFIACYRNFAIGEFDAHTGERIHRKIWRL